MVYNRRVSIVHDDRPLGYVPRSWPGTQKVEAASIQTGNSGSDKTVSTLFSGRSGARAHALQLSYVEKPICQRHKPHELVIVVLGVLRTVQPPQIITGRGVQLYSRGISVELQVQGSQNI